MLKAPLLRLSEYLWVLILVCPIHDILKWPTGKVALQIGEKQAHRFRHISGGIIRTDVRIDHQVRAGPKL